jgi:hypothetical protein
MIERRLTAQDLAQPEGVAPAMRAGVRRASREESDQFYGRQSRAYLVVRLKCDHPAVQSSPAPRVRLLRFLPKPPSQVVGWFTGGR